MMIPKSKRLFHLLRKTKNCVLGLVPFVAVLNSTLAFGQTQSVKPSRPVRERILLDDDWRFKQGDPAGATGLIYDVRPPLKGEVQDKAPDAAAEEAEKAGPSLQPMLKSWILPTGNKFIKDPSHHFVRPPGNPGGDVSYVQPSFDDSGWQHM